MRIVQLSDLHLSISNIEDLRRNYLKELISELIVINSIKSIDVIIITGDLVDKGGDSLKLIHEYKAKTKFSAYDIFEKEFIDPICGKLSLDKKNILFVPGNHDIDRNQIDKLSEAGELSLITDTGKANDRYQELKEGKKIANSNKRIERFKKFEQKYASKNYIGSSYDFSYFESSFVFEHLGQKIGFALINDSWRCSNTLLQSNHFFGTDQLLNCLNFFDFHETSINIAVMHHPLDAINKLEKVLTEDILFNKKYSILFCGHYHSQRVLISGPSQDKLILTIRGRTAFDKPDEPISNYQPGYNIVDINLAKNQILVIKRKYNKDTFDFHDEPPIGPTVFDIKMVEKPPLDKQKYLIDYED